jgi:hypothetical protein
MGFANGRHRKKRIQSLIQDQRLIEGHEQLKSYITNYYKRLFGAPEDSSFSLDETQVADIPQLSITENDLLTAPYTEEEVQEAIFFKWNTIKLWG